MRRLVLRRRRRAPRRLCGWTRSTCPATMARVGSGRRRGGGARRAQHEMGSGRSWSVTPTAGSRSARAPPGSPHAAALIYLCAFLFFYFQFPRCDAPRAAAVDQHSTRAAQLHHVAQDTERSLYGDCPPEVAGAATVRLTPQSVAAIATPQTVAAWQELPSTYRDLRAGRGGTHAGAGGDGVTRTIHRSSCSPRTRRSCRAGRCGGDHSAGALRDQPSGPARADARVEPHDREVAERPDCDDQHRRPQRRGVRGAFSWEAASWAPGRARAFLAKGSQR